MSLDRSTRISMFAVRGGDRRWFNVFNSRFRAIRETTRPASHLPHACQVFLGGGGSLMRLPSLLNTTLRTVYED